MAKEGCIKCMDNCLNCNSEFYCLKCRETNPKLSDASNIIFKYNLYTHNLFIKIAKFPMDITP